MACIIHLYIQMYITNSEYPINQWMATVRSLHPYLIVPVTEIEWFSLNISGDCIPVNQLFPLNFS